MLYIYIIYKYIYREIYFKAIMQFVRHIIKTNLFVNCPNTLLKYLPNALH